MHGAPSAGAALCAFGFDRRSVLSALGGVEIGGVGGEIERIFWKIVTFL